MFYFQSVKAFGCLSQESLRLRWKIDENCILLMGEIDKSRVLRLYPQFMITWNINIRIWCPQQEMKSAVAGHWFWKFSLRSEISEFHTPWSSDSIDFAYGYIEKSWVLSVWKSSSFRIHSWVKRKTSFQTHPGKWRCANTSYCFVFWGTNGIRQLTI